MNKQKKSRRPARNTTTTQLNLSRLREGALIAWVALALYLLLALGSYTPTDPGWSTTGTTATAHNAAGPLGAWLADVLFSLFGYVAYLLPIILLYRAGLLFVGYRTQRQNTAQPAATEPFDWVVLTLRLVGLCLIIVASTALVVISVGELSVLPFGSGGALGETVASASIETLSLLGAQLVLIALLLFGITVFTDLSWLGLMDRIGAGVLFAIAALIKACGILVAGYQRAMRWACDQFIAWRAARPPKATPHREPTVRKMPTITVAPPKPKPAPETASPLFVAPVTGSLPSLKLLDPANNDRHSGYSAEQLESLSRLLESKLLDFGVQAEVVEVLPGPVITRFEIQLGTGIKVSKVSGLAKDIARSLAVISVRVVEVIPGKSVVGIEIPNEDRAVVNYRAVLASPTYQDAPSPLTLALGHDISGEPVVADLAKMPHLLVAGTTGSGKSVGVNAMLLSLLYKATPREVRLILVDPKMLELSVYEGIPHLLTPVITDMKDAANGLRWCVAEMERRYKLMSALGVRNLAGFNRKVSEAISVDEPINDPLQDADVEVPATLEPLPMIVVVIDEFADMMMVVGKKVEELIARIAQKARAAGIHLILATQRPSVDVITGLIKANVPTRIAFQVSSKVDSRTIIDQGGAEQLLGNGDMLYLPPGSGLPVRIHGAFVSDDEVHRVVADWKQRSEPNYIDGLLEQGANGGGSEQGSQHSDDNGETDELYDQAVAFVLESRRASISAVQRKLRIGYNRAARLIETMEAAGVVSAMGNNGNREVLVPSQVMSQK